MKLKAWLKSNDAVFAGRDLRFLLAVTLKENYLLLSGRDYELPLKVFRKLEKALKQYKQGVPMAYILGKEEFYGLEFAVNRAVLIPRPETELLAERALEIIKDHAIKDVLEIGSGSGNLAVVIKKLSSKAITMTSCDISPRALKVARKNALKHRVKVVFTLSDLFAKFQNRKFDLIVSNPPYVACGAGAPELKYEPAKALYAGRNGLACIKKIITQAPAFLSQKGFLLIETGYNHKQGLSRCLKSSAYWHKPRWIRDYQGHSRILCLKAR